MTQKHTPDQGGLTLANIQQQYRTQFDVDLVFNQNRHMIQNARRASESNLHPIFEIALAGICPQGGR